MLWPTGEPGGVRQTLGRDSVLERAYFTAVVLEELLFPPPRTKTGSGWYLKDNSSVGSSERGKKRRQRKPCLFISKYTRAVLPALFVSGAGTCSPPFTRTHPGCSQQFNDCLALLCQSPCKRVEADSRPLEAASQGRCQLSETCLHWVLVLLEFP